jgi:ribosomal protein S14
MGTSINVKVLGTWKTATKAYQKVNGEWKTITSMSPKINGEYKIVPFHTHNYNLFVTTYEPTCSSVGYDVYSCECGASTSLNIKDINPDNHGWEVYYEATKSTCTTHGNTEGKRCKHCGKDESPDLLPLADHTPSSSGINHFVDSDNKLQHYENCKVCGTPYERPIENQPTWLPTDPWNTKHYTVCPICGDKVYDDCILMCPEPIYNPTYNVCTVCGYSFGGNI